MGTCGSKSDVKLEAVKMTDITVAPNADVADRGMAHEETLDSAYNLAEVLDASGRTEEAARLRSEYGV